MRTHPFSRLAGSAGVAAALLAVCAPAGAQPANNMCADAIPVVAGVPVSGSTAGATVEHNFATYCQDDAGEVWYSFTTPEAGPYEFTLSGSPHAGLSLMLVTGCGFPMGLNGCAFGGAEPARLEYLSWFAGEVVLIRVGSTNPGGQSFTVGAGPLPPPPNDTCATPTPLVLGLPVETHNLSATTSAQLPMAELCSSLAPGIAAGADIYFSFTAPYDGYFDFSTCGSHIDTVVSVHTGCPVSEANAVACNDNAPIPRCTGFDSHSSYLIGAHLNAKQTYIVRVASVLPSFGGELGAPGRGPITLLVQAGGPPPAPTNGTCDTAEPIGPNSLVSGTTINTPGGDGVCALGLDDHWGAWYAYTSQDPEPTVVEFMVWSGAFNNQATMTAVRGCGGEVITCQAFNPLTNPEMRITFSVDPQETVLVRVAGIMAAQGDFQLQTLTLGAAPPNLTCDTALPVGLGETVFVDTSAAASADESSCGQGLTDIYPVWYTFTPAASGYYRLATDLAPDSPGGASLAVYTACGSASVVCALRGDADSQHPNAGATAMFLDGGAPVWLRVARLYAGRGGFELRVDGPLPPPPPVANDTCGAAVTVSAMPFTDQVNVTLATPDQDVCHIVGQPARPTPGGIWYRYTPEVDEVFLGNASAQPNFGGSVAVFTGECGSLTQVGCPDSFQALPAVPLEAGVTYHILASLAPGRFGEEITTIPYGTVLSVSFVSVPVPANDLCAVAAAITESAEFSVNTLAAGPDGPAPSCVGWNGMLANAVWYTFRTTSAGTLFVEGRRGQGASLTYSPGGALFQGECGALSEVACGTPAMGLILRDRFSFTVPLEAGVRYRLAIGSWAAPAGGETDVTFSFSGGLAGACPADWNDDGQVNSGDITAFLTSWLASIGAGDLAADFNGDGLVNSGDITAFLTAWLGAVGGGC